MKPFTPTLALWGRKPRLFILDDEDLFSVFYGLQFGLQTLGRRHQVRVIVCCVVVYSLDSVRTTVLCLPVLCLTIYV
jgi:hypothetical protein